MWGRAVAEKMTDRTVPTDIFTGGREMMNGVVLLMAGVDDVLKPLENLKILVLAVIGAIGVIILAKNLMEFATAYQQQDSSTMNSALKGIVAGAIMAAITTVLAFLGFS